ncbi:hypothetical protein [Tortoise microvirus 96]|nr:hypothetical protein [Tortoise microvirus 96]QPB07385.1 MAG: hypothetical protein [Microvirus sp.]
MPINICPTAREPQVLDFEDSVVEPDEAMSVTDIIRRHLSGQPLSVPGDYDGTDVGDNELDDSDDEMFDAISQRIDAMDLTEIDEMRSMLNNRAASIRAQLKAQEDAALKQQIKDEMEKDSQSDPLDNSHPA